MSHRKMQSNIGCLDRKYTPIEYENGYLLYCSDVPLVFCYGLPSEQGFTIFFHYIQCLLYTLHTPYFPTHIPFLSEQEGTIGNDLVVKPVPSAILVPEDGFVDDEMFLDEDESYERSRHNNSLYSRPSNNSLRRNQPAGGAHFVYRGQMMSNDSHSDFRKI